MSVYYEQMNTLGKWTPIIAAEAPTIKDGRIKFAEGFGPRIRNLMQIPDHMQGVGLVEIQSMLVNSNT